MRRVRPAFLPLLLAAGACTERLTAPGVCPNFCPADSLHVEDTVLADVIVRDSAFSGYLQGFEGEALPVADLPGIVDSRAIFVMNKIEMRVQPGTDTATVPITGDSSWLRLRIVRRDTNTTNLRLTLYRLPITIDSATTFDSVAADFSGAPIDSVNIDSLLADSLITDTALTNPRGGPYRADSAGHLLQFSGADSILVLTFVLDTVQAPFVEADSGRLAFGVRVSADTLASIALGANDVDDSDARIRRFYQYQKMIDSTTDSTVHAFADRETTFDGFVFNPPTPALDSGSVDTMLVAGGVPAVRSLVRVAIPAILRDTADVVRATLVLVPVAPVQGAPGDSFIVIARPVVTDLGPKSPLVSNEAFWGRKTVQIGSADTLRIEVTEMIRSWALDTTAATAFVLGLIPEAATYAQIRFYSSRASAFRPALHVTYVRRFPFGTAPPAAPGPPP
jgi:hypothetical protein